MVENMVDSRLFKPGVASKLYGMLNFMFGNPELLASRPPRPVVACLPQGVGSE